MQYEIPDPETPAEIFPETPTPEIPTPETPTLCTPALCSVNTCTVEWTGCGSLPLRFVTGSSIATSSPALGPNGFDKSGQWL